MSEIFIDIEKCSGCAICTRDCPYQILEVKNESHKAAVNPAVAAYCSHCGHCETVCPEGAISITYADAGQVLDLTNETNPTIGQISRLMVSRRSVREYKKQTVPREIFEQIFDRIRYAPTGMNGQSVQWLVIQKPEDVQALVGNVQR